MLSDPKIRFDKYVHLYPYQDTHFYDDDTGYAVWRPGTGMNVEYPDKDIDVHIYQTLS